MTRQVLLVQRKGGHRAVFSVGQIGDNETGVFIERGYRTDVPFFVLNEELCLDGGVVWQ
jgi:hypothetical protein